MEKTTNNFASIQTSNKISPDYAVEVLVPTDSLATLYSRPFQLVPEPGEGQLIEFIDAVLIYKYGTEPMSQGGSIYISYKGFSALSASVSAITLMGEEADKSVQMQLGSTADMALPVNAGLYLQMTESDFDKGSSTSFARIHLIYRIHIVG
jgi:hypothetical protein